MIKKTLAALCLMLPMLPLDAQPVQQASKCPQGMVEIHGQGVTVCTNRDLRLKFLGEMK